MSLTAAARAWPFGRNPTHFPAADARDPGLLDSVVDRYRRACMWLVAASLAIATSLVILVDVELDTSGTASIAILLAGLLVMSRLSRHWRYARLGDCFGALGLVWLGGLAGGAISLLGLRLGLPMVDRSLLAADLALGLDGQAFTGWIAQNPQWHPLMVASYDYTVAILSVSVAAVALLGHRVEAWRAAFCFLGTLLTVCLVSLLTPAKGLGIWAADELLTHLPNGAMRYFWGHFDEFYAGTQPVLRLHSLDGVVSFPSYHIIMGLITVTLWRRRPVGAGLAMAWLMPMLAATVPLGGHYFVDLIGGATVWIAWYAISARMERASDSL